jgi:GNAT superfamily N-acetyltransferase
VDGTPQITLATADEPELVEAARQLFREYAQAIGVDLCFQDFDAEVENLPGEYAAPAGALLVALLDGQPAGCGALGRLIAQQLIDLAMQAGYSTLLLDTLDDMEAARGLYDSLGFESIPPYYYNPIPGAHYLKVDLDATGTRW